MTPSNLFRRGHGALLAAGLMISVGPVLAAPIVIDFEDAPGGAIGGFYSGLGVTFSNTKRWGPTSLAGMSGSYAVSAISGGVQPTPTQPLVATFTTGMQMVGITGIDVGSNGIQIDAYDSVSGGALIATDQFFGPGVGVGIFATITANSPGILRVEFYQPQNVVGDGVIWDDFTFEALAVPEPVSLALLGLGLAGLGLARRRR